MADAFEAMMNALDRTEAALERSRFERTMDEWANGQISLEDAHDALVRLGHDPEESDDLLRKHDRRRFAREKQRINGELAGAI